jgi:hypothetical protein
MERVQWVWAFYPHFWWHCVWGREIMQSSYTSGLKFDVELYMLQLVAMI